MTLLFLGSSLLSNPTSLHAQVRPDLDWRTITTTHFYIHFTPPVEGLARRIAADAERAYAQLSDQLHPPRGKIDVVVSDDIDASNGSATPFPTNRIIVYANPPINETALRYTNDWGQMVISHELTHIFHLDRTRGIWALGQDVFGRAATLFPNFYSPSWITEGLAVYEESRIAGAGRIEGSEHRMIARASAIDRRFPSIGTLSLAYGRFPFGEEAYGYGSLFIDYLARTKGSDKVGAFVEKSSAELIPYLYDIPSRAAFGTSFTRAFKQFADSIIKSVPSFAPPMPGWRQLTNDGVYVFAPRWLGDTSIIYSGTPGRESFGAYRVNLSGKRTRVGRRNNRSPNVVLGPNRYLFSQSDFVNPYQLRSDLWIEDRGRERQLTFGQRLMDPDARGDGQIVAEQILPGATRLVLVSPDGRTITPITNGSYDELWTEPRWSPSGQFIAAIRWVRGNISQVVALDPATKMIRVLASARAIQSAPSWQTDARVFFTSDVTGEAQVYSVTTDGRTTRVSNAATGLFEPQLSSQTGELASVYFKSDGYHLGVAPCCDAASPTSREVPRMNDTTSRAAPLVIDSSAATKYSPWRTFWPRYWLPTLDQGIRGGNRLGAETSGYDVVGRHSMTAAVQFPLNGLGGITGNASYQYLGFGMPAIQIDGSDDWESLGSAFQRDASRTPIGEVFRRTLTADALATYVHQRVRTAYAFTGGVALEHRTHFLDGASGIPLSSLDTTGALGSPTFPTAIVAAQFSNVQRPPLSISPEDGISVAATVRDRFNSGANGLGSSSYSTVATASVFKSLDFPGFSHHVLALRGAAGISDDRAAGYYSVGGVSGETYSIIPGYTVGEGRKTFPVRGFDPGTLIGTRAFTGSAEYRLPLFLIGNAPGPLPFFLDRSSLTFFGDYGVAWCPNINPTREVCNQPNTIYSSRLAIGSVGTELNLNLGVLSWDVPYRVRLGVVAPTQNRLTFGRPQLQAYLVGGVSF